MRYLKLFEKFSERKKNILIIVDVQKSFQEYFTNNYLKSLQKFCEKYDEVYQIFDNHHQGKDVDKDYLYDKKPELDDTSDLFDFPNQKDVIEKRYNYDVDSEFYKKILDEEIHQEIKKLEEDKSIKKGQYFPTKEGTIIVYIGNNHKYFHVPLKLYNLFSELNQAQKDRGDIVTIVGGAGSECLEDVIIAAESLGIKINKNPKFIYTAKNCPIP